jgi:hypothetical protein
MAVMERKSKEGEPQESPMVASEKKKTKQKKKREGGVMDSCKWTGNYQAKTMKKLKVLFDALSTFIFTT